MQSIVKMNEELKIRLFYVLSITAIVANTIGFISNAIIYGFTSITIFTLVCAIIMYIAGIMGMYTKNSKLPSVIILVLGNIIEFPKNQEFKNKEIQDKFYVATELLKRIIEHGHEFNITVTRDAALEVFEERDQKIKDLLVISTSKEFERNLKYKDKSYFYVTGDEFK